MPSSARSSDSVMEVEPSIDTMMPTFRFMVHRKLRRRAHGQYRRHSSKRYYFSAFVIGLFLTLVGLGAQKLELATSWPQLFLAIVLLLAMIYIVVKVSIVVRWCFYCGTVFEKFKAQPDQDPDKNVTVGVKVVLIVLALLECLTIGVVLLLRVAYPRIVLRAQWLNCKRWWRIRDTPRPLSMSATYKTIMFSYLSWDPDEYRLERSSISYVGEFDEFGQPHGLGEWTDHTFTGEALQGNGGELGIWEHGVPIGPFKSQEYGTGNAFSSIRIGFCKNSTDKNHSTTFSTARDPNGMSYGAAAVECSVSGKFFHHLPYARIIGAPVLRSELERKAKEDEGTATIALAYPLSFLSTFAESLQSRPSIRGSFHGVSASSKKIAPLSKSIVVRYTDQGILIPGYIRSGRRRTDVNEVLIRRVCPPNLDNEKQHFGAADNSDAGTEAPRSQDTVPTLMLPSSNRTRSGSASSGASDDLDSRHAKTLLVLGEGSDHGRRSFDKGRKKRIHQQVGLVAEGWRQVLDVDGQVSSAMSAARAGHEALIFVHGYNCALTYGIARLGQLLSLGEFPPYIKPFVFSWPSSTTMGYFNAKKVGCSDDVAKDLRQLIADLREAGFQRVHILAHSMGARIVLSALRKGYLSDVLAEREVMADGEPSLFSSMIESETPLKARRKSVRYRDSVPGAPRPLSADSLHEDGHLTGPVQLASFTLLNPDADLDIFLEDDYWMLSKYCPHITLYADARDGALFWSEILGRKKSLGRHPRTLVYTPTGEALDVDVIDTTSLDVNIHSLRHNFFNLNRMLVDDLYDIVVLGRRAREREGRLSSRWTFSAEGIENGEVYTFLCAPSYVVNK
ncbi:hypothetical protein BGZ51_005768 [Haplosporangium sp. Z 767]|nr:hypothetical protein BGZ51_005768 [Haplosporangium sp. Z 767]KAF9181152.1 hypothetical protein BGZ50_005705 [Haplosporangium sp. Z 11]